MSLDISEEQIEWAYELFNYLAPNGEWTLPDVGVYRKTGENNLTLVNLFASKPRLDDVVSIFDQHRFVVLLAESIGWTVDEAIEKAYDVNDELISIPENRMGDLAICSKKCGAILRVEPPEPGTLLTKIEGGVCPVCKRNGFDAEEWDGMYVVVDERATSFKANGEDGEE